MRDSSRCRMRATWWRGTGTTCSRMRSCGFSCRRDRGALATGGRRVRSPILARRGAPRARAPRDGAGVRYRSIAAGERVVRDLLVVDVTEAAELAAAFFGD